MIQDVTLNSISSILYGPIRIEGRPEVWSQRLRGRSNMRELTLNERHALSMSGPFCDEKTWIKAVESAIHRFIASHPA